MFSGGIGSVLCMYISPKGVCDGGIKYLGLGCHSGQNKTLSGQNETPSGQ